MRDLDCQYTKLIQDIDFQPIFIMGDHRSGTTLLYRLLDATHCFNVVRAYHILRYDEILAHHIHQTEDAAKQQLAQNFREAGVLDRMIDGVPVTPDLPEEYGFVISQSYKSRIQPNTLGRFVELCKKIQYIADAKKPLLLKNPWDYFLNFMYVKQVFPAARFIFLQRHPLHVINSQLYAIRRSFQIKNLYITLISRWYAHVHANPVRRLALRLLFSAYCDVGWRITTRHVAHAWIYFLTHVKKLPVHDYIVMKYEDICQAPARSIDILLEFLAIKPGAAPDYADIIDPRPFQLLPDVTRNYAPIRRQIQSYCDLYRYTLSC